VERLSVCRVLTESEVEKLSSYSEKRGLVEGGRAGARRKALRFYFLFLNSFALSISVT
jgi:hypothetical protein